MKRFITILFVVAMVAAPAAAVWLGAQSGGGPYTKGSRYNAYQHELSGGNETTPLMDMRSCATSRFTLHLASGTASAVLEGCEADATNCMALAPAADGSTVNGAELSSAVGWVRVDITCTACVGSVKLMCGGS